MQLSDTIVAIATGTSGAMGVVRLSGPQALTVAGQLWSGKRTPGQMAGYTAALGRVRDRSGELDEAVLTVFRAPHSYTGEDVCELSCHGSRYLLEQVVAAAIAAGARPAAAGEFTRRALQNGKLTLTEAEAVAELIASESRQAARAALEAKDGLLFRTVGELASRLMDSAAHLAAWIDYPEEDVEAVLLGDLQQSLADAHTRLGGLVERYGAGRLLRAGIATAIVGSPNVGKSTLMNLLAGCQRSIVTDIAGTTRDVIEESVRLGELLLRLSDTAGMRDTADPVEQLGVARSAELLERCDLVLAIFDGSRTLDADDHALLQKLQGRLAIGVLNKSDLPRQADLAAIAAHTRAVVELSAREGDGIERLEAAVAQLVGTEQLAPGSAQLLNDRQLAAVVAAVASLDEGLQALRDGQTLDAVSVCLEECIDALLELTGQRASAEVVDRVFEQFCVGK